MRAYLLVALVAATVTFLLTPLARWIAMRTGGMTAVRARDVHTVPTPRLGGLAMLAGLAVAFLVASQIGFLEDVFASGEAWAILVGATLVALLGAADDIWDLDWMTKLAGQVLAAGVMAWQGIQLITVPIAGLTIGSGRLSLFLTVLAVVTAMNAVNFVDGLDGLAAGLIAIGGGAFFLYTYLLTQSTNPTDYSDLATLATIALVGVCIGFLPHNFHPSRIFMGDSGSMLIGLVIAAAAIVVTGRIDPARISEGQSIPAFLPILLPLAVIVLPLLDMVLAVGRRTLKGKSPFHPDRMHIHHRLLQLGHTHRRAVVVMYLWTAVLAFGAASLVRFTAVEVAVGMAIAALVVLALTLGPLGGTVKRRRTGVAAATGAAGTTHDS